MATVLADLETRVDGLFTYITTKALDAAFGTNLPFVGSALSSVVQGGVPFLTTLETKINATLEALDAASTPQQIAKALDDLDDVTASAVGNVVNFQIGTHDSFTPAASPFSLEVGLPALKFEVGGTANFNLGYTLNLGLSYDTQSHILTTAVGTKEIELDLNAGFNIAGGAKLGFIGVDIMDKNPNPELALKVAINIDDGKDVTTLGLGNVKTLIGGDVNLLLGLTTDLSTKLLPQLTTDLHVGYHVTAFDPSSGLSGLGVTPTIALEDIQLELGSVVDFLAKTFGPIIHDIFGTFPLGPLIDIATAPIPIIDPAVHAIGLTDLFDVVGPDGVINLLDIAAYAGADAKVLGDFALAFNLIKGISEASSSGHATISLGSLTLLGDAPAAQNGNALQIPNEYSVGDAIFSGPTGQQVKDAATTGLSGQLGNNPTPKPGLGGILEPLVNILSKAGLDVPLFTNPEQTVKALLLSGFGGPPVPLITYDVPELTYVATYEQFFPIIGPIGIGFKGKFGTTIDVNFGYDTSGIASGHFEDGFYLFTKPQEPHNGQNFAPAASMGIEIDAAAGINLGFVSIEVGGGLAANLNAYLDADPTSGRLYLAHPGCLVSPIAGEFDATVFVDFSINFIFFQWEHRFDIADITLAEFSFGCDAPTSEPGHGLAEFGAGDRTVLLHAGENAHFWQINGKEGTDTSEHFEIRNARDGMGVLIPNKLDVSSHTIHETYGDGGILFQINATLGDKRDVLVIAEDVLVGSLIDGGDGDDLLVGGAGQDILIGGAGFDHLIGGAGNDTLVGGKDADTLEGGLGADNIDGGDGIDQVTYEHSKQGVIFSRDTDKDGVFHGHGGEAEGDTLKNVEYIVGSHFDDRLYGNPDEKNTLEGLAGNDILVGGDEDDYIIGGAGADVLIGGDNSGGDTGGDGTSFVTSAAGVVVNLVTGKGSGGDAEGDTYKGIEHVQGSVYDDVITGNAERNIIDGYYGDDRLSGGGGKDTVSGGEGDDIVYGGADGDELDGGGTNFNRGHDLLTYERFQSSNNSTGVTVDLWAGDKNDKYNNSGDDKIARALIHKADGAQDVDVFAAHVSTFEDLTGSKFNDTLTGDDQYNVIKGLAGNDIIHGMGGNDTLIGGAGADALYGDAGIDLADYIDSTDGVIVDLAVGGGSKGDALGDVLVSIENLRGSDYADTLLGSFGDNEIDPGLSRFGLTDVVDGRAGVDTLVLDYSRGDVGKGLVGGFDMGSFDSGSFSRQELNTAAQRDGVIFTGIEKLNVTGTAKADIVFGGGGNDTVYGGRGNDLIFGGLGVDRLFGGAGNDIIVSGSDATRQLSLLGGTDEVQLVGGSGIDTLSISLAAYKGNVVLTGTDGTADFDGVNAALKNGTGISEFELLYAVVTGQGDDKITQPGTFDNFFVTGFGVDEIRSGLGKDYVDGGIEFRIGSEVSGPDANGLLTPTGPIDALYANDGDLLVLDYSTESTAVFGSVHTASTQLFVKSANGQTLLQSNSGNYTSGANSTDFVNIERLDVTGSSAGDLLIGTDLLFGRNVGPDGAIASSKSLRGDDHLSGGGGNDLLIGNTGDDTLLGGDGDDVLLGTSVGTSRGPVVDRGEIDTLTGGKGSDVFVLGADLGGALPLVYYNDGAALAVGGNAVGDRTISGSNRAIITDFATEDHIQLGGVQSDYRSETIGGSTFIYLRDGLDGGGIAAPKNDELIAELKGVTSFSLDAPYVTYVGSSVLAGGGRVGAPTPVTDALTLRLIAADPTANGAASLEARQTSGAQTVEAVAQVKFANPVPVPHDVAPVLKSAALLSNNASPAPDWVTQTSNPADLRAALFNGQTNLSQGKFTLQGDGAAFGTFNGDPFGLGHGIVISTGDVTQLAGVNLIDGGHKIAPAHDLHFVKIGHVGLNDIYRADLTGIGFDIKSLKLGDASGGLGGSGGRASGFDIGAVALSHTKLDAVTNSTNLDSSAILPRIDAFEFDAAHVVFTPGSQRPPSSGFDNAADLAGSANGLPLFETVGFDRFADPNLSGYLSLGDGGQLGLELNQTVGTAGPLYLYVAETGANGEELSAGFTASADRLNSPTDLSTDLGAPGIAGDDISLTYAFTPFGNKDVPDQSINQVTFDFVFFSEELVEYVQSGFNDTFKITLNGVNLALLSDGSAASIDTLYAPNAGGSATSDIHNLRTDTIVSDFIYNPVGTGPAASQTRADGYSKVLHFTGAINPGVENILKIEVKDVRDGLLDSGILIRGGSFRGESVNHFFVNGAETPIAEGEHRPINFGLTVPTGGSATGALSVTFHPTAGIDLGAGAGHDVVRTISAKDGLTGHIDAVALSDGRNDGTRYESVSVEVKPALLGNALVSTEGGGPHYDTAPLVFEVHDSLVALTRTIGDAPARFNRAAPNAWADAWTAHGVHITHTANLNAREPVYSAVDFGTANPKLLSGSDILAGDLGVSGQAKGAPGLPQEITSGEALKFDFDSGTLSAFTIDFARFERGDSAKIELHDSHGTIIRTDTTSAASFGLSNLHGVAEIIVSANSGAFVLDKVTFTENYDALVAGVFLPDRSSDLLPPHFANDMFVQGDMQFMRVA